jgi:pimeloyl-ACP methyl ester carboxylesterase
MENRDLEKGRWIDLKIVRLGPTGPVVSDRPLFIVLGGPGSSVTAAAGGLSRQFAAIRTGRPLVLVDQRGTGGSSPLECNLYPGVTVGRLAGDLFPREVIRDCLRRFEGMADLRQYSTIRAAEDLEEVRRALDYDQVDLYGVSYGTRVVLQFMRRFPTSVRTAILHGVTAPDQMGRYARSIQAQRALNGVLEECLLIEECASAFPDIEERTKIVFERLRQVPVDVEVIDPETGRFERIELNGDLAAEAIRYMLYSPRHASFIPLVLHEAEYGNFDAIADFALFGRRFIVNSGGNGLYLSVTCSEDLAASNPALAARMARGTFLSDYTYRQLHDVCEFWPRAEVNDEFFEPVYFSGPVLAITGEWDPATPPSQAEELLPGLTGGVHLVVPHGGHDFDGLTNGACIYDLFLRFFRDPETELPSNDCLASIQRPEFVTMPLPMKAFHLESAELTRFQGTYFNTDIGFTATITMEGDHLWFILPDGTRFPLLAVERDSFRTAGLLGTYFRFDNNKPDELRLTIEQPGAPPLALARLEG